jgi:hypothetical protein
MPTGVTNAWGYPIGALAGQLNTMTIGDHPLTYELGMTSYPPTFPGGKFQSPLYGLTPSASAFGSRRISKKSCKLFLKNKSRNPLTGRKIKRGGKTFKKLMKECQRHKLIKKKKL